MVAIWWDFCDLLHYSRVKCCLSTSRGTVMRRRLPEARLARYAPDNESRNVTVSGRRGRKVSARNDRLCVSGRGTDADVEAPGGGCFDGDHRDGRPVAIALDLDRLIQLRRTEQSIIAAALATVHRPRMNAAW